VLALQHGQHHRLLLLLLAATASKSLRGKAHGQQRSCHPHAPAVAAHPALCTAS
jgi:hypothetical protein